MSIVSDVLKHIPFTTEDMISDEVFSYSIKNYIANALSELMQNGIGTPVDLFGETDPEWDDFFSGQELCKVGIPMAKDYVYIQVLILFDTPQPGTLALLKDKSRESLIRARLEFESDLWKPII